MSEKDAKNNIIIRCKEKGYEFLGFVGGKYINNKTKMILKCLRNVNHGQWQSTSYNDFVGKKGVGCPICNESKGATLVAKTLEKYRFVKFSQEKMPGVKYYSREYMFDDCKSKVKNVKDKNANVKNKNTNVKNKNLDTVGDKILTILDEMSGKITINKIKSYLSDYGLKKTGNKDELLDRLNKYCIKIKNEKNL